MRRTLDRARTPTSTCNLLAPSAPAKKSFLTNSIHERRISGADDPSAISVRLATVGFHVCGGGGGLMTCSCDRMVIRSAPSVLLRVRRTRISICFLDAILGDSISTDSGSTALRTSASTSIHRERLVITDMDSMNTSAIIATPINVHARRIAYLRRVCTY